MTDTPDDFNDALRRSYAASRAKSARPVFHDQANVAPEDVLSRALRQGKSQGEAERLARHHAAVHGDADTFAQVLRTDLAAAQNRQRI